LKKINVLDKGYVIIVDSMGDDKTVVNAARVSFDSDNLVESELTNSDEKLIRYLMRHQHMTPFEMVELAFIVHIPMDCWRQMVRHRTANVNEISSRYVEIPDFRQKTKQGDWRLQSKDNKQGSSGFLEPSVLTPNGEVAGYYLSEREDELHNFAQEVYQERLKLGIAKEQARKDLPLSTYTRLYWKCDLRNIFNFLKLRLDSHAQYEIRQYAGAISEFVKEIVPICYTAFEDYILNSVTFSAAEFKILKEFLPMKSIESFSNFDGMDLREKKEFLAKIKE
jgi:thymidylate synthase (FAD)